VILRTKAKGSPAPMARSSTSSAPSHDVTNAGANALLAIGASPVMAHAP